MSVWPQMSPAPTHLTNMNNLCVGVRLQRPENRLLQVTPTPAGQPAPEDQD